MTKIEIDVTNGELAWETVVDPLAERRRALVDVASTLMDQLVTAVFALVLPAWLHATTPAV